MDEITLSRYALELILEKGIETHGELKGQIESLSRDIQDVENNMANLLIKIESINKFIISQKKLSKENTKLRWSFWTAVSVAVVGASATIAGILFKK